METRLKVFGELNRRIPVIRSICHVLIGALLSQAFVSCAGGFFSTSQRGKKYAYTYRLVQPAENDDMSYQDEFIKMQFKFDDATLRFQLDNLSNSLMTVRWNHVSLGVDNRYSAVRHSVDFYSDTSSLGTSVLLPPGGYILETVIPAENIRFDGTRWNERDLFPTTDHGDSAAAASILANVGKSVVLMLRVQHGESLKDYRFGFQVSSVTEIAWNDYRPSKRTPPVMKKPEAGVGDEITTAVIFVGILGFIAFIVSLEKSPVSE